MDGSSLFRYSNPSLLAAISVSGISKCNLRTGFVAVIAAAVVVVVFRAGTYIALIIDWFHLY